MAGCPGSSKTMTLTAAMATLERCIGGALGSTFRTTTARDRNLLRSMSEIQAKGVLKAPTVVGSRNSIGLDVLKVSQPVGRTNSFEFNDIAGEDFVTALESAGMKPWVLSSLRGTNTVVLFFDLTLEPSIRELLVNSQHGAQWGAVIGQAHEATMASRGNPALNQFALLEQLLGDIEKFRGVEDLNIIMVIPKADLFTDQDRDEIFFLNSVFEKLSQWNALLPAEHDVNQDQDDWNNCVTLGGIGANIPGVSPQDDLVSRQLKFMRAVSVETRSALLKIDNALGSEASAQSRQQLSEQVRIRLIERAESIVGGERVFWLPVSAVGRDHSAEVIQNSHNGAQRDAIETNRPLTSKLAEYVVLGPIALALAAEQGEVKTSEDEHESSHGNGSTSSAALEEEVLATLQV